jgi:hypothetical protein
LDGNLARALGRADQEIEAFIERRAAEREALNAEAAAERLRETSYLRHRNGDHTQEWAEFDRMQIAAAESKRARPVENLGKLKDDAAKLGGADA